MNVTFTLERLRKMPRPPEYLDELRACAVSVTETEMTFELESKCYQGLIRKYQPQVIQNGSSPVPHTPQQQRSSRDATVSRDASRARKGCGCGRAKR